MKAETAMQRALSALLLCLVLAPARADERAGDFTHYVLALSWTPSWCALEGDRRAADQCGAGREVAFTLHGLWPQGEEGWPAWCRTSARDATRAETAAMADIMGSSGLAWHEWKKHGRCSGLTAEAYFALSRAAYEGIVRPGMLETLDRAVEIEPGVVEQAFLAANPRLAADEIAVTCRDGLLQDVRICLTKSLAPRPCTPQVERGCRAASVTLLPVR